jgi:hypothetical protein
MSSNARQTSSIYSSFELEDLVRQISSEAREQENYTIAQMEEENEKLKAELWSLKSASSSLYQVFCNSRDIAMQLSTLHKQVVKERKRELNVWAANSTAF